MYWHALCNWVVHNDVVNVMVSLSYGRNYFASFLVSDSHELFDLFTKAGEHFCNFWVMKKLSKYFNELINKNFQKISEET